MRSILKGGKPQVQSRMDFHYDFLMKTMQNQSMKWLDILEDSYWHKQHTLSIQSEVKQIDNLQTKITATNLDEVVQKDLDEKHDLQELVKSTTNAKRKEAQRLLDRWNNTHMGPKWINSEENYKQLKIYKKDLVSTEKNLAFMKTFHGNAEQWLDVLRSGGFIVDNKLTNKGILATECNESHTILTPEFYLRGLHKNLSGNELLTVMACFIDEKETDATPSLDDMNVSKFVKDALYGIDEISREYMKLESDHGVYSRESFWKLSTTWIEPVSRWLEGEDSPAQICADYGLFEGNFVRTILRIANMTDEWNAMATYLEDVQLLDSLRDVYGKLIRDMLVPDSLYLHL
jgi:superfamily II RNA helicase